jgi:hypothetical protein
MTRKEDVEKVRQMVSSTEAERKKQAGIEATRDLEYRNQQLREVKLAEERLKSTGIVDFFEKLRDQGIVKWDHRPVYKLKRTFWGEKLVKIKDYLPACILLEENTVRIFFDNETGPYNVKSYLEGERLIVEGREKMVVGKSLNMADVISKAILKPRNDYSWRGLYEYPEYQLSFPENNPDGCFLKMSKGPICFPRD